jgi:phage shock protein A
MQDDFDLTGLDKQSAKEYVVAVIADLKQLKAKRIEAEGRLKLWQGRVRLADGEGRSDLADKARAQVDLVSGELSDIKRQELEYSRGVDRMKTQLKMIESQSDMSINADLLLAQLEMVVGERDELSEAFKDQEVSDELERLKREMEGDE